MDLMADKASSKRSTAESIQNIFVPKDVELDFTLYTLWITE